MSIELNKLAAEFNRYFTSSNGVDVPAKVSVSRDEWRALFTAIQQAEAQQPSSREHLFELWWGAHMPNATQEQAWTAFTAAVASNGVGIAAKQPAMTEPVAWLYIENGEVMFGHPNGYRPPDARPLVFGDTHPAPGVPDDVVRDAKRWRVSELISEAALKHPDSRTEAENTAFNTYRAAFSSGNSYASCIDAAMLAASPAQKGGE